MAKITKIESWKGHLTAFKAKTQGTTSGQLFVPIKTAFHRFWPPRPLEASAGTPFSALIFPPDTPDRKAATEIKKGKVE